MPDAAPMTAEERTTWDEAVAFYRKNYMERDLLFDDGMLKIKDELRRFENKDSLDGAAIDPALAATLTRVAPIYRKYFWPKHREANEKWIAMIEPMLAKYGPEIRDRIARSYETTWPAQPIPIDLTPTAGANAAYTSTATAPAHTTIDANEPTYRGYGALEIIFHEPSHMWGTKLINPIARYAAARAVKVPRQLWHAVLFYNAGEITRRVLAEHGVNDYVQYAEKYKVFEQLCGAGCEERVAAVWNPHLDGTTSIDQALKHLVDDWPPH